MLVDRLLDRLPEAGAARAPGKRAKAAPAAAPAGDAAPIRPQDIAAAANALLREHGPHPIASDVGDCLFTAMDMDPTALVAPGYYATMGYGVPAGLGLDQRLEGTGIAQLTQCPGSSSADILVAIVQRFD